MMAGTAIISASKVPFRKIFSTEIFTSPFSEFGFNVNNVIYYHIKIIHSRLPNRIGN